MQNGFITPIERPKSLTEFCHTHTIMLFGSCFAEHIGARLADAKFACDINPFGVLYNPMSIAEALKQIGQGRSYSPDSPELVEHNGWHSLMHHSSFSAPSVNHCIDSINLRLNRATENWEKTDRLILTFGSAYVYHYNATGCIVGNCHKIPEREFTRRRLTCDEIVDAYESLIQSWISERPSLKILFTVSPIRHQKDGFHANQLSKAVLLLAVDALVKRFPAHCFYFPAYEIMMDELRDYRFYNDDMLHPTPLAINYIWERFKSYYLSKQTQKTLQEWEVIQKALNHRPSNPASEAYNEFVNQLITKLEHFSQTHPEINIQNELTSCHTRLKK